MRSSTIAFLATLVATPLVSAAPTSKRSTCTANLGGHNTYGGGSPSNTITNQNNWVFGIQGGSEGDYGRTISTDAGGAFDFTTGWADYGGNHNMDVRASWDYAGLSWTNCQLSLDGGEFMTAEPVQTIKSNVVSVTSSKCTWEFEC